MDKISPEEKIQWMKKFFRRKNLSVLLRQK